MNKLELFRFFRDTFVPPSLRPRFNFWCRYVLYNRWYRFYFLGSFNLLKYVSRPLGKRKKRILAFENFYNNSPALGSFLEFQMRALCLAELHDIDTIDIALIYDLKTPLWNPKMSKWLSPSNFQLLLYEILPLLNLNSKLGSVFVFNCRDDFESFLTQHSGEYILCPSLFHYINKSGAASGNYGFVRNFYLKKRYLPQFVFKPNIALWAKAFIKKYAGDKYPVAVNLRMNPFFGENRNSDIPSWRHLFEYCLNKHPEIVFLLLAQQQEAPDDLKHMSNIIFVKNHKTTMEQDMCLIKHSLFFMGVASGPTSFTNLTNDIPYRVFRVQMFDRSYTYNWHKPGSQWPWAEKTLQKLVWEKESPDSLIKEFEHLFRLVDKESWRKKMEVDQSKIKILEWPYIYEDNQTQSKN